MIRNRKNLTYMYAKVNRKHWLLCLANLDLQLLEPLADGEDIAVLRLRCQHKPDPNDGEDHDAELRPGQAEAPGLDEHEYKQRPAAARQAIDRHIDERLRAASKACRKSRV